MPTQVTVMTIITSLVWLKVVTSHQPSDSILSSKVLAHLSPGAKSSVLQNKQNIDSVTRDLHTSNFKYRRKREASDSQYYKPIRIAVMYLNTAKLEPAELQRLKHIVGTVVSTTRQILSVYPVVGALRLPRTFNVACQRMSSGGLNSGKCYETCFNGIDNFKIPDNHLEGLYSDSGDRRTLIEEGVGVNNTDFILYLRAIVTHTCSVKTNILAYSIYCKTDLVDRPIAGYINLCPGSLRHSVFSDDHITKIMQHELFHTLGFSKHLFKSFRSCTASASGLKCYNQYKPIQFWNGTTRLATPKVLRAMQEHYGCTVDSFGGPLAVNRPNSYTSHWDARFLQGSIMTSNINKPHLVSLDKITLAAFEDMGWYRVNHRLERPFLWGKGDGCYFGLDSPCSASRVSDSLCSNRGELGCHYLHMDKAVCQSPPGFRDCKTFVPLDGGECFMPQNTTGYSLHNEEHGETFLPRSRCFVSNLTIDGAINFTKPQGRCYKHRCNDTNLLEIKIGNLEWVTCPFNTIITVDGYSGAVQCPRKGVLCFKPDPKPVTTTSSLSLSTTHTTITTTPHSIIDKSKKLKVELTFKSVNYDNLNIDQFKDDVIDTVTNMTGIAKYRLVDIKVRKGSVIISFNVLPAKVATDGPVTADVYKTVLNAVKAGNFTVISGNKVYSADVIAQVTELKPRSKSNAINGGAIVGAVVGSLVLVAVIILVVVAISRYKQEQNRVSPTSSNTTIEMDARSQRNSPSASTSTRGIMVSHIGQTIDDQLHNIYFVDNRPDPVT